MVHTQTLILMTFHIPLLGIIAKTATESMTRFTEELVEVH